jgi:cytochrome c oxidase subunit 4
MNDLAGSKGEQHHFGTRFYVMIWLALVCLTLLTVGVTYLDLKKLTLVAALVIASVKASLVFLYFMHLRSESRVLATALLVGLGAFVIFIGLTFSDVFYRFQ